MVNFPDFPATFDTTGIPRISLVDILRWFWEAHDPTQGMGQGNDRGTQPLGSDSTFNGCGVCWCFGTLESIPINIAAI